jgi:hypothetical protein
VVDHWALDGESSSSLAFLSLHTREMRFVAC